MGVSPHLPEKGVPPAPPPGAPKIDTPARQQPPAELVGPSRPIPAIQLGSGAVRTSPEAAASPLTRTVSTSASSPASSTVGASLYHAIVRSPGATISSGYGAVCFARGEWIAAACFAVAGAVSIWNRFRDSYYGASKEEKSASSPKPRTLLGRAFEYAESRVRRPAFDLETGAAYCLVGAA